MFVCILLVTVLTAHSLQVAGMVPAPKGGELSYKFQEPQNLERFRRDTATAEPERSQFIDTLFNMSGPKWLPLFRRKSTPITDKPPLSVHIKLPKFDFLNKNIGQNIIENAVARQIEQRPYLKIPIKTLTAVNNLIQSSRPAIKKFREFAAKRFEKTTKPPTAAETDSQIQKRSPVYIRPVGGEPN